MPQACQALLTSLPPGPTQVALHNSLPALPAAPTIQLPPTSTAQPVSLPKAPRPESSQPCLCRPGSPEFGLLVTPLLVYWALAVFYDVLDHLDLPITRRFKVVRKVRGRENIPSKRQVRGCGSARVAHATCQGKARAQNGGVGCALGVSCAQ
eukprot:326675-Chlamydomonas_euryale.AAC.8